MEIIGFILAYIFIGYGFGKILNREYLNYTPTKELSLFGKLKRLLLFPVTYHFWGKREEDHTRVVDKSFRNYAGCGNIDTSPEQQKNYCKLLALVWPLPMTSNLIIALIQLTFFMGANALTVITSIPSITTCAFKPVIRKLLPHYATNKEEIDEIEKFQNNELGELEEKLMILLKDKERYLRELRSSDEEWKKCILTPNIDVILSAIRVQISNSEESLQKINKIAGAIREKKEVMQNSLITLRQCDKTTGLKLHITVENKDKFLKDDAVALVFAEALASAKTAMQEIKELETEDL